MKTKKRSKGRKGTQTRTEVGSRTRTSAKLARRPRAPSDTNPPVRNQPSSSEGCEEVEVGDIGGFGDAEELEAHEKRCGERPTEFCQSCARNLCSSHYELLHRDHDASSVHKIVKGMTTSNQ